MGIRHFSGLFVLLCVGVAGALLTLAGEHAFYRLVLPRIRRRQKFKYWLHTSQKIHRALNMTYEDVKKQQANPEKSCNLQKAQPPQPPPGPPAPGSSGKWNNEGSKEAADGARDNKRVHFNLETLNSRRLLAKASASESEGRGGGEGRGVASLTSRLCENGGPTSFASLVLSLPSSSSTPPPSSSSSGGPPRPGELQELQEKIEVIRDQLRAALARRAELQTSLAKEKANPIPTVTGTPPLPLPTATPLPLQRTRCATTMTDPPVQTVPKLRSVNSRHTSEKR